MASRFRGYLRQLRRFNSRRYNHGSPGAVVAVRLGMAVPHLSQQPAPFFGMPLGAIETIRPFFKLLEPNRQPVAVTPVLDPVRPIDQRSGDSPQPEF